MSNMPEEAPTLSIDMVADFVCVWCHVGGARLGAALAMLAAQRPDVRVTVRHQPFLLDTAMPDDGHPYPDYLVRKFGSLDAVKGLQAQVSAAAEGSGVHFDFAAIRRRPSTVKAHRLILRLQAAEADPARVAALVHAIFRAYFEQGQDIGRSAVLATLADAAGLGAPDLIDWLDGAELADEVLAQHRQIRDRGVQGVPFFILNDAVGLSGAQPAEVLLRAMLDALSPTT
ncbi:DsbA family oxidoreductase [Denitromonas sp. IR12]|uniref:DsbA family oxidoreductase n=2 Tax=Denitromonas iodatirespirans TaxID=2795389 RepID=A0A944DRK1_DENI1|nr:DsbA family oxidoreductase [Denitromonas iodatirespirans]